MALYPNKFSSDTSLKPKNKKEGKKMACSKGKKSPKKGCATKKCGKKGGK